MTITTEDYFCFSVERIRLAIPLHSIDRVIRAVAATLVPRTPDLIFGLIDFHGKVVPVINLRRRLGLNQVKVSPDQVFIMAETSCRTLALVADAVDGVRSFKSGDLISSTTLDPGIEARGVVRTRDGMILVYDIDQFLSDEESVQLEKAIRYCQTENIAL